MLDDYLRTIPPDSDFIDLGDGYYIRLEYDGRLMSWSIYLKKARQFWRVRSGLSERAAHDLVEMAKATP